MATVNNVLGQEDTIRHKRGTLFDKTFDVYTQSAGVKTEFPLTDYNGTIRIKQKVDGTLLYEKTTDDPELTFDNNSVRWLDSIAINKLGDLYFELEIVLKTNNEERYKPWYGKFQNAL